MTGATERPEANESGTPGIVRVDRRVRPQCSACGWRMGGLDSWSGHACKCGKTAEPIALIGEREKTCRRCGEAWPADAEFFRPRAAGSPRMLAWCRACEAQQKADRRKLTGALT